MATDINFPKVQAVAGGYTPTYIPSTAATKSIKGTPALLHTIAVTKAGAASSTVTVYDSSDNSGAVLAVLDGTVVMTHTLDIETAVGLCVVTAGSTGPTCTVSSL